MIRLLISPTVPGRFTARQESDGLVIVISGAQPLVDGARRLLELGVSADTPLTMRHAGKSYDSFEPQSVGAWAGLTYGERDHGSLRVERWKPDSRYATAPKVDDSCSRGT